MDEASTKNFAYIDACETAGVIEISEIAPQSLRVTLDRGAFGGDGACFPDQCFSRGGARARKSALHAAKH